MNRSTWLRAAFALSASVTMASPIAIPPRPANAILPVFDAANYGKLIEEAVKLGKIGADTAASASRALNLYNEYVKQGRLNIKDLWPVIQPYLKDLSSVSTWAMTMPTKGQVLYTTFSSQFGDYTPDQPYGDEWEFARAKARRAIESTLVTAQILNPKLKAEALTIDKLVKQPVTSQTDLLHLHANLAAELNQQMIDQRQELSQQTVSQSQYYSAILAQNEATRRSPGAQQLMQSLRDATRLLGAPSAGAAVHAFWLSGSDRQRTVVA